VLGLSIAEKIVQWVEPAFAVAGYEIVAVAVLAERSIFIGLIVPGDVILALGGVYASKGKLSLPLVIVCSDLKIVSSAGTGANF